MKRPLVHMLIMVGAVHVWAQGNTVTASAQFHCEPKTTLKIMSLRKN